MLEKNDIICQFFFPLIPFPLESEVGGQFDHKPLFHNVDFYLKYFQFQVYFCLRTLIITQEITKKVAAVLLKSKTSNRKLLDTIQLLTDDNFKTY